MFRKKQNPQALRNQQLAWIASVPGATCQNQRTQGIWDIAVVTKYGPLTFRITLPPGFPQAPPQYHILVQARHPWVTPQLQIVGHPSLKMWRPQNNCGTIARDIAYEFTRNPPTPVAAQPKPVVHGISVPAPQPARVSPQASPRPYAGGGLQRPAHLQQPKPQGRPAARSFGGGGGAAAVALGPPPSEHVRAKSAQLGPPPKFEEEVKLERQDSMMQAPAIPDTFDQLDACSTMQLEELLNDPVAFGDFLDSFESVQNLNDIRHDLYKSLEPIARENLKKKEQIEEAQAELEALRSEVAAKQLHFKDLLLKQQQFLKRYSPMALRGALAKASNNADEESEAVLRKFKDEDIDANTFCKQYAALRTKYHTYEAKKERLAEVYGV